MSRALLSLVSIISAAMASTAVLKITSERSKILAREAEMSLGGNVKLSPEEERANEIIMKHKLHEIEEGFLHPETFNFSHHYFTYKNKIEDSALYQIIKTMPKGALLHVHDTGILGPDYIVKLTYLDDLYISFQGDEIALQFSNKTPESKESEEWQLVKDARAASGSPKKFDKELRRHFTIVVKDPKSIDTNVNAAWDRFARVFQVITPLLTYKPIWEKYFYDALLALRAEKIMYAEIRSTLPSLYDLDGTTYDSLETARVYKRTNDRFVADHPDFLGAKIIFAPHRLVEDSVVESYLKTAKQLKNELGDFVAGFDLVGQEDLGRPLRDFMPLLVEAKDEIDYFFHAGETNWYGTSSDENLVDAVVLGAKRIGHGFALLKHPVVVDLVRQQKIGIEVNVISNQVLCLVEDIRNHPLSEFLAQNLPVVISSDDPGLWEAPPVSHDYYIAFAGVANRHSGLRTLKQLVLNSILYSAMDESTKTSAYQKFQNQWDTFIGKLVGERGNN